MESKKQEAIKKAYGKHYKLCKPDQQGYTESDEEILGLEFCGDGVDYLDFGCSNKWRPESLSGIENNNGWISIEPDGSNLPKIDFHTKHWFCNGESTWIATMSLDMKIGNDPITHYQPMIVPKPPIY